MKLTGIGFKRAGEMIRAAEQRERDEAEQGRKLKRLAREARQKAFLAEKEALRAERKAWIATLSPYERFLEESLDILARRYEESDIKPI